MTALLSVLIIILSVIILEITDRLYNKIDKDITDARRIVLLSVNIRYAIKKLLFIIDIIAILILIGAFVNLILYFK